MNRAFSLSKRLKKVVRRALLLKKRPNAANELLGCPLNRVKIPVIHGGRAVLAMNCVLGGAEWAPCMAAQLGR